MKEEDRALRALAKLGDMDIICSCGGVLLEQEEGYFNCTSCDRKWLTTTSSDILANGHVFSHVSDLKL
jgi:hypothetical protein